MKSLLWRVDRAVGKGSGSGLEARLQEALGAEGRSLARAVGNRKPFGGLKQRGGIVSTVCVLRLLCLGLEDGQAGNGRQGAKDQAVPICP